MHSEARLFAPARTADNSDAKILTELFIVLGFMTFYLPASYAVPPIVYKLWKVSGVIVSVFAGLSILKQGKLNKRYLILAIYYLWFLIGTHFTSVNGKIHLYTFLTSAGFFAYLEYLLHTRSLKSVMRTYLVAGMIISLIHFASFIIYADVVGGMKHGEAVYSVTGQAHLNTQNWYFLKHDNGSIYYFIPEIVLLFYYSLYYNKDAFKYFLAYNAFILYMFISKTAATAMVASIFMFLSLMYLYALRKHKNLVSYSIFNYKSAFITGMIADIAPILIVGGSFALNIAKNFGKSATFSGCASIWAKSFMYIIRHPLTGLGIEDSTLTTLKIGINHCHNLIVENLYVGGIIALILFFAIIYCYRPVKPDRFKTAIFSVAIIAFFVTASMDWYYYYPLPLSIFVFNYYANKNS